MLNRREALLAGLALPLVGMVKSQVQSEKKAVWRGPKFAAVTYEVLQNGNSVLFRDFQAGLLTPNEVRLLNGLPRIES